MSTKLTLFISFFIFSLACFGQGPNINIGYNKSGVAFGTSIYHNGIKFALLDRGSGKVNGLNTAISSKAKNVNGISFGALITADALVNGLQFGAIGNTSELMNGITIGGLYIGGKVINGFGAAGLALSADTLNGLFLSGMGSSYWNTDSISVINGVTIGIIGGSTTKKLNGLSLGFIHNVIGVQKGVSISAWNRARELHGLQIGLLNFAGNNKKAFRWLPIINFNLKKPPSSQT
jgi:hypothetical protein